ncbi:MAG: ParB/RepB/Spo0J family partition protein [Candidatus Thiodiazotropha sp. (ex Dulcina madagascariensis)]|nr:ParB/RepB/Spo0J family partition protein [Candidatus Thiodiazotropha sp. (ex Dulcina madagascariensis)]
MAAKKQAAAAVVSQKPSSLGLDSIGDLSGLLNQPVGGNGGPLELPIELIDEDPNQPRHEDSPGFTKQSLGELADTIRERKVKSPISVRPHPEVEGRYMINHGARRYRASIIAEKTTIPAYIDPDYTEADQVIENLQRNDLTPREIADWIGRELARGKKKRDIAKELGKSPAFVTQHVTLLDLPEPIADAFNDSRVNDVTVINELVKAHKQSPDEVAAWMDDDTQDLTRGSVKLLREFLDDKQHGGDDDPQGEGGAGDDNEESEPKTKSKKPKEVDPGKLKKAIVIVKHEETSGRLLLDRRPTKEGLAWIKYEMDGQEVEVDLLGVELVAVMEA